MTPAEILSAAGLGVSLIERLLKLARDNGGALPARIDVAALVRRREQLRIERAAMVARAKRR